MEPTIPNRRSGHGSQQRASRRLSNPLHQRAPEPLEDYDPPSWYENLSEAAEPSPVAEPDSSTLRPVDSLEQQQERHKRKQDAKTKRRSQRRKDGDPATAYNAPSAYANLSEAVEPPPAAEPDSSTLQPANSFEHQQERHRRRQDVEAARISGRDEAGAAPAPEIPRRVLPGEEVTTRSLPGRQRSVAPHRASRLITQLYTVSYLIFFSILGTLARLGLQRLTYYPGAPATTGVLWANFAGTLIMGFFAEDHRLFAAFHETSHEGTAHSSSSTQIWSGSPQSAKERQRADEAKASHLVVKRTIPLYIGLTTGFCGSLTSFSSFMRDAFLALSNDLPTPPSISTADILPRNGGYSLAALLAILLLTLCLSLAALILGSHLSLLLSHLRLVPTLPTRIQRLVLDPLFVLLALLAWLAVLILSLLPPDAPDAATPFASPSWPAESWRGDALLALVLAPPGCLLRFALATRLNALRPAFPLGTFAANVFGTAVLAVCFDLQRVRLGGAAGGAVGGGTVACQVLRGVDDGFCGALTTVSTFAAELVALRRRHAYLYGAASVGAGLAVVVAVMGSVRWGVGWEDPVCGS